LSYLVYQGSLNLIIYFNFPILKEFILVTVSLVRGVSGK